MKRLGIGIDSSFRAPMAIVVIGGLITSTFLSLLVIPVLFTYVDDMVQQLKRLFKHNSASDSKSAKSGRLAQVSEPNLKN